MNSIEIKKELNELLEMTAKEGASDLHISIARYPTLRIDGRLIPLTNKEILTPAHAEELCFALLNEKQKDQFLKDKEIDLSYNFEERARFRVNIFRQKGYVGASLRLIPAEIRTIEELNLPSVIRKFTKLKQGFVLMVGPTGHGKSTSLAALIDEINHNRNDCIITIEDPIEYVFTQDRCIISQREIYHDSRSFHVALRSVFREDANVIMVGEMRDPETISTAVTAAETGHLVFATLHTNNAAQTIDRIIDSFPANQQSQIRAQLASSLQGIISQRLIPRVDGGRIPATEILLANAAVRNLIRENKNHQLDLVIETNFEEGMLSLNKSLANLVEKGEITRQNAELYSLNPKDLKMLLKNKQ
jgi:twitching motility protein PilT